MAYASSMMSKVYDLTNMENLDDYIDPNEDIDVLVNEYYLSLKKVDEENPFHTYPICDLRLEDDEFDDVDKRHLTIEDLPKHFHKMMESVKHNLSLIHISEPTRPY